MILPLPCATQIPATGNGTEEPRQEHEGVLDKDCHGTSFGQTCFGHPYLAEFDRSWPDRIGQFFVLVRARRGGAPAEGWDVRRVGGPKGEGPKILRYFFSLPPENSFFLLSLGFPRGILVVFEAPKCERPENLEHTHHTHKQTSTTNKHHQQATTSNNKQQQPETTTTTTTTKTKTTKTMTTTTAENLVKTQKHQNWPNEVTKTNWPNSDFFGQMRFWPNAGMTRG